MASSGVSVVHKNWPQSSGKDRGNGSVQAATCAIGWVRRIGSQEGAAHPQFTMQAARRSVTCGTSCCEHRITREELRTRLSLVANRTA